MTALTDFVAREVESFYVSPRWVADYYNVTRLQVHRAIDDGRLTAVRVRGMGARDVVVLDRRLLPESFPGR